MVGCSRCTFPSIHVETPSRSRSVVWCVLCVCMRRVWCVGCVCTCGVVCGVGGVCGVCGVGGVVVRVCGVW